jgi:hypothetical protein
MPKSSIEKTFDEQAIVFLKENIPQNPDELEPKIWNTFSRMTFVHKQDKERLTIDLSLRFENQSESLELPNILIAELKQGKKTNESYFLKLMRAMKIHPMRISKYCIGSAILHKDLKQNRFKYNIQIIKKFNHGNDA